MIKKNVCIYIYIYVCVCLCVSIAYWLMCWIAISLIIEFEPKSSYYVYFRANTLKKDMNPIYPLAMG